MKRILIRPSYNRITIELQSAIGQYGPNLEVIYFFNMSTIETPEQCVKSVQS